jgi:hypothetical protein
VARDPKAGTDAARPPTPASTFLRGLTVGALVGAAIAGTMLVGRRRRERHPISSDPTVRTPGADPS